tara:strand:+ start:1255 stop:2157 length:903 start_codon:yes stop_codon:yes gene_type:complete
MLTKHDKRKFLRPEIVAQLNSMLLRAKMVVEGSIIGKHRSPYHGFSVEFAEHRSYGFGDEIRHIDWKLFGKTDRLYIKRYEEETNLSAHLILDISNSMLYGSKKITKLKYANSLIASLAYLMINQQDATGLVQFSNKINRFILPKSRPSHLNVILSQLDDNITEPDTNIEPVLHEMAERISKRGLIVLCSDLMDNPEKIINGLKHFRHKKQEVIVFHIFDRKEFEFDFKSRIKFLDMETKQEIDSEPWHIRESYTKLVSDLQKYFRRNCRKNLIDYIPVFSDQSLESCIIEYLNKRKKLS